MWVYLVFDKNSIFIIKECFLSVMAFFILAGGWVIKIERVSVAMASVGVAPTSGFKESLGDGEIGVDDILPEEMSDMKIRDDRVRCSLC